MTARGSLPEIVRNDANLYLGDLAHYFRVVFLHAPNLQAPYHNFRHMSHVLTLCHQACLYYQGRLDRRQMRNLLIAALFHDFNHCATAGGDERNIQEALRGLEMHLLPEDRPALGDIAGLIRASEYPPRTPAEGLELRARILRDADLAQAFSAAWIQQVVFGLAAEWGKPPAEVLEMHARFIAALKFHTAWARQAFPPEVIGSKVAEAQELLALLAG
jgi:hypothetical protein